MNSPFDFDKLRGAMRLAAALAPVPRIRIEKAPHAVIRVQFRFPRSKKKRIRAKWAKREENVRYLPQILQMGNTYFVHPAIYRQLQRDMDLEQFEGGAFEWPATLEPPKPTLCDRIDDMAKKWMNQSLLAMCPPVSNYHAAS